jgi:hypothetical protein
MIAQRALVVIGVFRLSKPAGSTGDNRQNALLDNRMTTICQPFVNRFRLALSGGPHADLSGVAVALSLCNVSR